MIAIKRATITPATSDLDAYCASSIGTRNGNGTP